MPPKKATAVDKSSTFFLFLEFLILILKRKKKKLKKNQFLKKKNQKLINPFPQLNYLPLMNFLKVFAHGNQNSRIL